MYDALEAPPGQLRDVDLETVCHAIRSATPALPGRLSDADPLPAGMTLFIPTLWELNRVIFTENARLLTDMQARGFRHARRLLRCPPRAGCAVPLAPSRRLSANDVARAWTLTALLNLDGMDLFTARHLCDAEGITTLDELADQSQAALDRIWKRLSRPHTAGRPRSRCRAWRALAPSGQDPGIPEDAAMTKGA